MPQKKNKLPESRMRRIGKSTLVTNAFLASIKAGESPIYHHPEYVCISRKQFEEFSTQQATNSPRKGKRMTDTNKPTPEWETDFDFQFMQLRDENDLWMDTDVTGNRIKKFISQQLTAFSKEVEGVIGTSDVTSELHPNKYALHRNDLRAEQLQALSNLNKKWGIRV
jgi:hypothetical protein